MDDAVDAGQPHPLLALERFCRQGTTDGYLYGDTALQNDYVGRKRSHMRAKDELSAAVHAETLAVLRLRPTDLIGVESNGGPTSWRSKARASPSAHGLQRLHRDSARGRFVAQLGGDKKRDPEDRIDDTLAESFPASDPPYWTLGVERPGLETEKENGHKLPPVEG
jgi:hypothetical protein